MESEIWLRKWVRKFPFYWNKNLNAFNSFQFRKFNDPNFSLSLNSAQLCKSLSNSNLAIVKLGRFSSSFGSICFAFFFFAFWLSLKIIQSNCVYKMKQEEKKWAQFVSHRECVTKIGNVLYVPYSISTVCFPFCMESNEKFSFNKQTNKLTNRTHSRCFELFSV